MEITDTVSSKLFESGNWDGTEQSRFHIYNKDDQIGLDIETRLLGSNQETEEITQLDISRIEEDTVRRMKSKLGKWLQRDNNESEYWETAPVEGNYKDSSTEKSVGQLEIEIGKEGIKILAISSGDQPVENAVNIPSTPEIHDNNIENYRHLERFFSLLEIFLAGTEEGTGDIMLFTRYLLNPETHLHPELPDECQSRWDNDDHIGVIQAAATRLDEMLDQKVPDKKSRGCSGASLATQAFKTDDPVFRWGYNDDEQKGLMYLYTGAFKALRNPASHRFDDPDKNRFLDNIDQKDALDGLCLFNFLIRCLDRYGTEELEQEDSK